MLQAGTMTAVFATSWKLWFHLSEQIKERWKWIIRSAQGGSVLLVHLHPVPAPPQSQQSLKAALQHWDLYHGDSCHGITLFWRLRDSSLQLVSHLSVFLSMFNLKLVQFWPKSALKQKLMYLYLGSA